MIGEERIILVGGPGGVGKTTIAATLGVKLAEAGAKTLVLTVDPARRLAQALGFHSFSSEVQPVDIPSVQAKYGGPRLFATMLDTQRYFDKVIEKFAKTPTQKDKILQNPIYRTMVESLGGTHEYAAMERLHELSQDTTYDRIVVDTPPMQNAIDLLKAPERLAAFMDNSVLRWFQNTPSLSKRLFQTTSKVAMKLMRAVFGKEFLAAFEELMKDFEGLQYGFKERHESVARLLKAPSTAFLLVTFPSPERFRESVLFSRALAEQNIRLKAAILNRVEPKAPSTAFHFDGLSELESQSVSQWLEYHRAVHTQQQRWIEEFRTALSPLTLRIIPRSAEPIHSIERLSRLGDLLIS